MIDFNRITEMINSQQGQSYTCSNRNVVCCYFAPGIKWFENFVRKNLNDGNVIKHSKDTVHLSNGERWLYFDSRRKFNCRGYRFYKAKVHVDIDENNFYENILPYLGNYCCELKWLI